MVHRLRLCLVLAATIAQTVVLADRTAAQVPPSAAEIAAYRGLHAAAASGDLPTLTKALQHGADINARDGHGRTALLVAAHGPHLDIVRELAKAGANMKAKDAQRYQDALRALVEAGADIAIPDRAGVTPLEHARRRGYAAMVTLLGG